MIPVAVSVPDHTAIQIQMETANWAFGKIRGTLRK
jgi:hypothetical protein